MRGDEMFSEPVTRVLLRLAERDQWRTILERRELLEIVERGVGHRISPKLLTRVLRRILPGDYPRLGRLGPSGGRQYLYVLPDRDDFIAFTETWYRPPAPVDTMDV